MEPMEQCGECGGWIKMYSPSTCSCGAKDRRYQVKEEFGDGAKVVNPYSPNRKQRRAQSRAKRRNRSKK